jgi:metacaspase-1
MYTFSKLFSINPFIISKPHFSFIGYTIHHIFKQEKKIITMASKQHRCNQCGTLLVVPIAVQAFKCAMCNGITHVQSTGPMNQAYNSLNHIAGLFRGFMNTITTSSAINSNSSNYGTAHFGYYHQPQPLRPSYPLVPPSPYGSKRAVLCGICYHGRSYKLKGSINDVKCMKYFLIKEFGFPSDSILMLTGITTLQT